MVRALAAGCLDHGLTQGRGCFAAAIAGQAQLFGDFESAAAPSFTAETVGQGRPIASGNLVCHTL